MSWVKFTPSHVVLHPVGHPNMEADLADTRSQLVPAPGQSQNSFSSENWISSSGHHLASENKMKVAPSGALGVLRTPVRAGSSWLTQIFVITMMVALSSISGEVEELWFLKFA